MSDATSATEASARPIHAGPPDGVRGQLDLRGDDAHAGNGAAVVRPPDLVELMHRIAPRAVMLIRALQGSRP